MPLPARVTIKDAEDICIDLMAGPNVGGALPNLLDDKKVAAANYWGLLAENGEQRFTVTQAGRELARGSSFHPAVFMYIIQNVLPYRAIIHFASEGRGESVSPAEIIRYWFKHFSADLATSRGTRLDQVFCFLHIAEAAGLGKLRIGRVGQSTRFEFNKQRVAEFVRG
jgi:hypothetical protein